MTYCFDTVDHNSRIEDTNRLVLSGRDIIVTGVERTGSHDVNMKSVNSEGKSSSRPSFYLLSGRFAVPSCISTSSQDRETTWAFTSLDYLRPWWAT